MSHRTDSNSAALKAFIHFDPVTPRSGVSTTERKVKLRAALLGQVTPEELLLARERLKNRVVKLEVTFRLWKGPPTVSDTRWIKDIDNLLKILFDVLGGGRQGLKLVEDDSYICEVQAFKSLVADQNKEGYLIRIQEIDDPEMVESLNESFAKRKASKIQGAPGPSS